MSSLDRTRDAFANLTERERRLITVLGIVLGSLIIVLPMYLVTSSISEIEDENEELTEVIRLIGRSESELLVRAQKRAAAQERYERQTPNLSAFVEAKGTQVGLEVANTTPQTTPPIDGFRRERVRVTLNGVGLRPFTELMHEILTSEYPVSITQLQIDKHRAGDSYRIVFDVTSYNRPRSAESANEGDGEGQEKRPQKRGRAGPPSP